MVPQLPHFRLRISVSLKKFKNTEFVFVEIQYELYTYISSLYAPIILDLPYLCLICPHSLPGCELLSPHDVAWIKLKVTECFTRTARYESPGRVQRKYIVLLLITRTLEMFYFSSEVLNEIANIGRTRKLWRHIPRRIIF